MPPAGGMQASNRRRRLLASRRNAGSTPICGTTIKPPPGLDAKARWRHRPVHSSTLPPAFLFSRLRRQLPPGGSNWLLNRRLNFNHRAAIPQLSTQHSALCTKKELPGIQAAPYVGKIYFSTISSTSMGQTLAQMPQAMHLEAGPSAFMTMTFMGQASTHLPQPTQSFLLIM